MSVRHGSDIHQARGWLCFDQDCAISGLQKQPECTGKARKEDLPPRVGVMDEKSTLCLPGRLPEREGIHLDSPAPEQCAALCIQSPGPAVMRTCAWSFSGGKIHETKQQSLQEAPQRQA